MSARKGRGKSTAAARDETVKDALAALRDLFDRSYPEGVKPGIIPDSMPKAYADLIRSLRTKDFAALQEAVRKDFDFLSLAAKELLGKEGLAASKSRIAGLGAKKLEWPLKPQGLPIPSPANLNVPEYEARTDELPTVPARLWPGRPPGRPKHVGDVDPLVEFIRDVYGPFFPRFRNKLRPYIWAKDRRLYRAIQNYEQGGRELPADIAMPTERDIAEERFLRAVQEGIDKLSKPARATVRKKLWRRERRQP